MSAITISSYIESLSGNILIEVGREDYASRKELLQWLSGILCMEIKNVDDLRTGVPFLKGLFMLWPEENIQKKTKKEPKTYVEFLANLKLMQKVMAKKKVAFDLSIAKMASGSATENYEALVWYKKFYITTQKIMEDRARVCTMYTNMIRRIAGLVTDVNDQKPENENIIIRVNGIFIRLN